MKNYVFVDSNLHPKMTNITLKCKVYVLVFILVDIENIISKWHTNGCSMTQKDSPDCIDVLLWLIIAKHGWANKT